MEKYSKYIAAAVQATPVFLDKNATVDKAVKIIDEAASNGAKLVAFAEGFIPGYPVFAFLGDINYVQKFYHKLYKNAVEIPGPAIQKISQCAKNNGVYVCISCTEKDGGSLYLTQLWFNPQGDLIGKHRKMRASINERVIWGDGEGSMMPVFETEIGNLGGLLCWEHLVPLDLCAMNAQNEQVHVASWPGADFLPDDTAIASRYYAMSTQTYVLQVPSYYSDEVKDMICETEDQRNFIEDMKHCDTCIYGPDGAVISNIVPGGTEGIAYGEIDIDKIIDMKFYIDPAGHYANKYLSMNFNCAPNPVMRKNGIGVQEPIKYSEINPPVIE